MPDKFSRGQVLDWQSGARCPISGKFISKVDMTGRSPTWTALNRLLDELDALPGETLIVLHNDHGEDLGTTVDLNNNHTLNEELVRDCSGCVRPVVCTPVVHHRPPPHWQTSRQPCTPRSPWTIHRRRTAWTCLLGLWRPVSLNHGHAHSRLATCSTATTAGPSFGRITSTSCTQGQGGKVLQSRQ